MFKGMHRIVSEVVRTCDICQWTKPINFRADGPTTSHQPDNVLETVSLDLMGPLPTGHGGVKYILVLVDTFSKYTKIYALKKATTMAILNRIEKDYIPNMGMPGRILSDNGTQFTAAKWRKVLQEKGIKIGYTTKYHPQANPVERYNREIGRILRTYCAAQHSKWSRYLDQVEYWINQLRSEVTEMTPWQIIEGIPPTRPIEGQIKFPRQPPPPDVEELVTTVRRKIREKAKKTKESRDRRKKHVTYRVGQQVLIRNHKQSNGPDGEIRKLFHLYIGPYIITKLIGESTIAVECIKTREADIVNMANVRPYFSKPDSQ